VAMKKLKRSAQGKSIDPSRYVCPPLLPPTKTHNSPLPCE
jgi:hypothetical protein